MSTDASKEWWGISLQGEERDLQVCAGMMPEGSDPWIQKIDEDGEVLYVLRSGDLDECASAIEVHMETGAVRSRFAGALTALGFARSVKTASVLQFNADGSRKPHSFIGGNMVVPSIIGSGTIHNAVIGDVKKAEETDPSNLQKLMSDKSSEVVDALTYLSNLDSWFNIYKLWEVMSQNYEGGQNSFKKDYGASKNEFDLFTTTMNFYRHHGKTLREDAFSFDGCRNFAIQLFSFWIFSSKRGPQRDGKQE